VDLFRRWGATYDPDPMYRYTLWRNFVDAPVDPCLWVMLNPSTATESVDDPTIRRCQDFSRLWGYDACRVVNVFALRSTDPRGLRLVVDPVGPLNDDAIAREAAAASRIVCAWGAHGTFKDRSLQVVHLLRHYDLWCFGQTKNGQPLHPLYQPSTSPLVKFR
jgi:hypothetical protein